MDSGDISYEIWSKISWSENNAAYIMVSFLLYNELGVSSKIPITLLGYIFVLLLGY